MTDEPKLPSMEEIYRHIQDSEWVPGPPRWSNHEAKRIYDELNARAQEIVHRYQRQMIMELEPINRQMADLYSKFASPTLYPLPKTMVKP